MTVVAGVAGWPILQSLSPLIQTAWIEAAGLDAVYGFHGPEDEAGFEALVARGRSGGLRGLNVTAPYKGLALTLADEASQTARASGSANLLVFEGGRAWAHSTDGAGLMAALAEQAPDFDPRGADVVVLGAGGAARAAVAVLVSSGARVGVLNRTRSRADALAADLGARAVDIGALDTATLLINALSVPPKVDLSRLPAGATVMDMAYRPLKTPFLAQAGARGLTGVDGLAMLIGQARPSFEALFGRPPPEIDVRGLAVRALEARG